MCGTPLDVAREHHAAVHAAARSERIRDRLRERLDLPLVLERAVEQPQRQVETPRQEDASRGARFEHRVAALEHACGERLRGGADISVRPGRRADLQRERRNTALHLTRRGLTA